MKILYDKMLTLLQSVPGLNWIDLDKGQLEGYDMRPALNFPCALLKIELPQCEDEGSKTQRCQARITVRVGFDFTGDTSLATPNANRDNALAYYDMIDRIYAAFQGYYDSDIAQLYRTNSFQEQRADGITVMQIIFETEFDDLTAAL